MMKVRFVSLTGPLKTVREEELSNAQAALAAVVEHAKSGGLSDVKAVQEDDGWSIRYTATTPGGRRGRNVAFADLYVECKPSSPMATSEGEILAEVIDRLGEYAALLDDTCCQFTPQECQLLLSALTRRMR